MTSRQVNKPRDMKKFIASLLHAIRGIRVGVMEHRNLKVQVGVAFATLIAGFFLDVSNLEWCLILLCIGLVISLELVNSAIEGLVDLVAPEWQPLAGKVKDLAAGSVLFFSLISLCVGIILFRKYLLV